MKIAVIHFGRKGAGPAISLEMAKALARLSHEIIYFASTEVENRLYVEKENFTKFFIPTYRSKRTYILSVILGNEIRKVVRLIKQQKPDVVYSPMNDMWAPFVFPKFKDFIRVKTIHDVGIHEGNNSMVNRWWNWTNFKDADKFVILSRKYVSELIERGINKNDIVVIPHAGFDYYKDLGQISSKQSGGKNILFFGRIDKYKGLEVLFAALPYIIEKHPDVKLSIVGNGDITDYANVITTHSANINVVNRWIKDDEVAEFVNACNVIVLPYTHATQSGVIPLAYAFSKPVVATRVGCLDEQVIDGETGYMCESHDPVALSDAINKMLDDPQKTRIMGEYAHNYMQKYLTWDASAKLLTDFLESQ